MRLLAHRIGEDGSLVPMDSPSDIEALLDGGDRAWVDAERVESAPTDTAEVEALGVQPSAVEQALSEFGFTRVVRHARGLSMELRVDPPEGSDASSHIGVWLAPERLVTLGPRSADCGRSWPPDAGALDVSEATPAGVFVALLERELDRTTQHAYRARDSVLGLDAKIDREATAVDLDAILTAKSALSQLLAVAEERREFMDLIASVAPDVPGLVPLSGALHLCQANAAATERMGERLERRLSATRALFDASQQEVVNRRLAVLTVLSAVFLPLTLMAGIWGMNFELMPELEYRFAYATALGAMGAVAIGLVVFFKRRGWLD